MRRLGGRGKEERGAVSILVAILMVVLLGFVALAVDVGLMYAEKAQLQNGADAAALSIAQSCANDPEDVLCTSPLAHAKSYADLNANDGLANIRDSVPDDPDQTVALNVDAGTVTVETGAMQPGGGENELSLNFSKVLGIDTATVGASATARWGSPSKGTAPFAIAFSQCEVDSGPTYDGDLQFLMSHGIGDKKDACHSTSSGHEIPGGFGWLEQEPAASCEVSIDLTDPLEYSDTGNNFKGQACQDKLDAWEDKLRSGQPVIQLFPVFDQTNGVKGNGGAFFVEAFAAIDIRGWNFNGSPYYMEPEAEDLFLNEYKNSDSGFVGKFIRYVSPAEAMEFGGSDKYGAEIVSLVIQEEPES